MKTPLLSTLFIAVFMQAQAATDTVSTGASYANQVWYSLANDEQGSAPKNNWDIAFEASGFGSTILINSIAGTTLWKYPHGDTAAWASVDTTGVSTWPTRWNSDTSWSLGAMGNYADASNPYDLDWGIYNMTTHIVTGDSLYVIKLAGGQYKKLWIVSLSGSIYTFKFADIDGSNLHTVTLDKSAYSGKNFGYYSLQSNTALNREPLSANWDLLFTQYTTFIPTAYTVTGVLANKGVQIAKESNLPNLSTYTNWSSSAFNTAINTIGYNWKSFTGTAYHIQDSLLFFVKPVNGDIWKVIFTGFGGSASGNYIFSKEKLYTQTGITSVSGINGGSLAVYPNPSVGQNVNVLYSLAASSPVAQLAVFDLAGKTVFTDNLDSTEGLHQYLLSTQQLTTGIYLVTVKAGSYSVQQRLTIQ